MGDGMVLHEQCSRWLWQWLWLWQWRWAEKARDAVLPVIRPATGEIWDMRGSGPVTVTQVFAGLWRASKGGARDRPFHETDHSTIQTTPRYRPTRQGVSETLCI